MLLYTSPSTSPSWKYETQRGFEQCKVHWLNLANMRRQELPPITHLDIHARLFASYGLKRVKLLQIAPGIYDPFKLGWVRTDDISHMSGRDKTNVPLKEAGLSKDGDWDQNVKNFKEDGIWYDILYTRYEDGVVWNDIPFIQKKVYEVKSGKSWGECRNICDVHEKLNRWDHIYNDIKENGYKRQIDVIEEEGVNSNFVSCLMRAYDEITIDIGRDGEPLFVNGHHRLSMAKILNINKVPVRVDVRHKKFVDTKKDLPLESEYDPFFGVVKMYTSSVGNT